MVANMRYVTVRKMEDGSMNKKDVKQLEQFFSEKNMRKQPIYEKIYAVSETEYIDEKKTTTKTTGYTFAIGSTSGGYDYIIGYLCDSGRGYMIQDLKGNYHDLKYGVNRAKEIMEREFAY